VLLGSAVCLGEALYVLWKSVGCSAAAPADTHVGQLQLLLLHAAIELARHSAHHPSSVPLLQLLLCHAAAH
jgi:hypothetical protein